MSNKIIINKLLDIARSINNGYNTLSYLSSMDLENSKEYNDTLKDMDRYFLLETVTCNKIDDDVIEDLLDYFEYEMDNDDDAKRCYHALIDRYIEITLENDPDVSYMMINDTSDSEYQEYLEDYDGEMIAAYDLIMTNIYIKAIKKTNMKIKEMIPNNSQENNLIISLKKRFTISKYEFFSINSFLERMGLMFEFDLDKIQEVDNNLEFRPVYYNECFKILEAINNIQEEELDEEKILELLFLTSLFDELIDTLDIDRLNNIGYYIKNNVSRNFYNGVCDDMITKRKKKLFN